MTKEYVYYNLFSPEGKLLQVEYALTALSKSPPILIAKNQDTIITVTKLSKRDYLLEKEEDTNDQHIFNVNSSLNGIITGLSADIDQMKYQASSLSSKLMFLHNREPNSQILSRALADKIQNLMQSSGQRSYCFGLVLFDNEDIYNGPNLFYLDTSAVCLPYRGIGIGENSSKINKFLENNLKTSCSLPELEDVALEAMAEAIGHDYNPNDVIVGCMKKNEKIRYYSTEEVDAILLRISEKN